MEADRSSANRERRDFCLTLNKNLKPIFIMSNIVKKDENLLPALMREVEGKIVEVRGQNQLL